jgi:hypothetical protein
MTTPIPDYVTPGKRFWLTIINGFREGPFAEMWFTWMEWALVTGAIHAIGVAANSELVKLIAWFSGITAMQYAINKIENATAHLETFVQPKRRWIRWLVKIPLYAAALGILFLVAYAFQIAVEQAGVIK